MSNPDIKVWAGAIICYNEENAIRIMLVTIPQFVPTRISFESGCKAIPKAKGLEFRGASHVAGGTMDA